MRRSPPHLGRRAGGPAAVRRRLRRRRRAVHRAARTPTADGHRGRRAAQITKNDANSSDLAEDRLQELHRAEGARRDLRPGPRRRGLQHVSTDLNLGDQDTALAALKGGEIDAYPEYTGTALTVVLQEGRRRPAQGPAGGLRARLKGRLRGGRHHGLPADAVHRPPTRSR